MKITSDWPNEIKQAVYSELQQELGEQPPTQEQLDQAAAEAGTQAAKLRNQLGAMHNPTPGKLK